MPVNDEPCAEPRYGDQVTLCVSIVSDDFAGEVADLQGRKAGLDIAELDAPGGSLRHRLTSGEARRRGPIASRMRGQAFQWLGPLRIVTEQSPLRIQGAAQVPFGASVMARRCDWRSGRHGIAHPRPLMVRCRQVNRSEGRVL